MPSRHCQRKRTQIAPETHFQKCVAENLVAFLRNGKRGAPKHPDGVHRPVKSSNGISRIGLAVVIDRTVALKARHCAVDIFESVVNPARKSLEICPFIRAVLQHQNGGHTPHKGCVECIDVHSRLCRSRFDFSHSRKPFHRLLYLGGKSGFAKNVPHKDRRDVEISHTVAKMVQSSLCATGCKSLVKKVTGHHNIHPGKFLFFRGVPCPRPGRGKIEKIVVIRTQQLSIFAERSRCIGDAEIEESLAVARKPNRLACHRSIWVFLNPIAFKHLPQVLDFRGFCRSDKAHKTPGHQFNILNIRSFKRLLRDIEPEIPALVEHKPMDVSPLIYKRSLKVWSVIACILKRRAYHAVEPKTSTTNSRRGRNHNFVHPFFRTAFHIPVERHPSSSPTGESKPIIEMATLPSLLAEGKTKRALHSPVSIDPKDESRYGGFFRIGILLQIWNMPRNRKFLPGTFPSPLKRMTSEFVMKGRDLHARVFARFHIADSVFERQHPEIFAIVHGLCSRYCTKTHCRGKRKVCFKSEFHRN